MSDVVELPESRIAAKEAVFLWNHEDGGQANEKVVITRKGAPEVRDWENYPASLGAICMGWCEDGHPKSYPEGIFAAEVLMNSHSRPISSAVRPWLEQLSKIEECEWARRMLAEVDRLIERTAGQRPFYSLPDMLKRIGQQRPDHRVKIEVAGPDIFVSIEKNDGYSVSFTGETAKKALDHCVSLIERQTGERFVR